MRLTLHTDYALRVLIYVGLKQEVLSTIPELVHHFDIPRGHLMKVVHRLARLGYLQTIRGKNGGMRLGREAGKINLAAVVRDMERELGVVGCLQSHPGYCRIEGCCVLRSALQEATDAFLTHLSGYTITDLLEPKSALVRLLDMETAGAPTM